MAGLAIAVAVGGHQSRDAKKWGIPRACGGFLTYSIMSWLETRKRYTFETSAARRGRPGEPGWPEPTSRYRPGTESGSW
ncbi:hypothetical protein FYZ41_09060 [Mobiluncus mulieris]|nr:hypothetical protein [Mobiluncus mulieris]